MTVIKLHKRFKRKIFLTSVQKNSKKFRVFNNVFQKRISRNRKFFPLQKFYGTSSFFGQKCLKWQSFIQIFVRSSLELGGLTIGLSLVPNAFILVYPKFLLGSCKQSNGRWTTDAIISLVSLVQLKFKTCKNNFVVRQTINLSANLTFFTKQPLTISELSPNGLEAKYQRFRSLELSQSLTYLLRGLMVPQKGYNQRVLFCEKVRLTLPSLKLA